MEVRFLGRPRQILLKLSKSITHRLNLLLKLRAPLLVSSIMAEPRPDTRLSEKRARGSPTGITPLQESKRQSGERRAQRKGTRPPSQRQLSFCPGNTGDKWTEQEDGALVEFILLTRSDQSWPADKSSVFWDSAAQYVFIRSKSTQKRTGNVRTQITCIDGHVIYKQFIHLRQLLPYQSDEGAGKEV